MDFISLEFQSSTDCSNTFNLISWSINVLPIIAEDAVAALKNGPRQWN